MIDKNTQTDRLIAANRILAREDVVDAFGHVSLRHPETPHRFVMSCSRAPELVDFDDLMEFELDGEAIDGQGRTPYGERMIHGAVFEARPDVTAVVHNHAYEVLPFGITEMPIRPVIHVASVIGADIPIWDIADKFGDTDMLVRTMEQGRDLAQTLQANNCLLMRGHGATVAGLSVQDAVMTSIYLQVNAQLQMDALRLGDVTNLHPGEVDIRLARSEKFIGNARAWEYLSRRAGR